ncbi:MAG: transposase [Candidatus Contendobacter sp.]|nr:transposase [Candidatus Contendobacter sp.]
MARPTGASAPGCPRFRPSAGSTGPIGSRPATGIATARSTPRFDRFARDFGAKYPKAVDILVKDRAVLLTFYDFPAEHWIQIRTPNPIASSFATIRHRTSRTKNCVSRNTLLGWVFQLALTAEKSWRKLRGFNRLPDVAKGIRFHDGIAVGDQPEETQKEQQKLAA